ncbi:MAG: nucleotidyltransferase domain-containing protein [Deltaproteobacteria bacterium]|nr:nucleotidyltransferase domain-containing protein [Deltaproteobacteria bacterium]
MNVVDRLKGFFAHRSEARFAYLFGSTARHGHGKLGDIDVAVFVEKGASDTCEYKPMLLAELMKALKTNKVDLVLLNEAGPLLCSRVLRDGIIVDSKDDMARVEFYVSTIRRYDDAKHLMQIQHYYMLRRIEAGRFGR